jgi:exopolysaccharide biosynthesis polyprenyl glycosylphosphotransferase
MSLAESESFTTPVAAPAALPAFPSVDPGVPAIWDGRGLVYVCILADALVLLIAAAVALITAQSSATVGYELLVLPPLASVLLAARGTYAWGIGGSPLDPAARAAGAVTIAAMAAIVLAVAGDAAPDVWPYAVATLLGTLGVLGVRALLAAGRRRALLQARSGQPALIVGAGAVGRRIARRLLADPTYGLHPVGFVDAASAEADLPPGIDREPALPVLGTTTELRNLAAATGARHVLIAFSPTTRDDELGQMLRDCEQLGLDVSVVPRLFDAVNGNLLYQRVGGLPLMGLRPSSRSRIQLRIKRLIDIFVSATLLALGAPMLAAVALAVRLESPGPALFRQRRLGRDGQQYDVLKFRSMRGETVGDFAPAAGHAPGGVEGVDRRTRLGRFLRRSSLDELPQLLNVLRGDMSLVGPRPERPEFAVAFARDIHRYDDRLRVRSGLTGWAQVNGLRGQTSIEDRVEWDNYYIEHWSLGLDLKILLMTLAVPFQPGES